jgi:gliding motility-associated-like protein
VIQAQTPVIANLPSDSTICQGAPVFQLPTPSVNGPFTSTSWQSVGSTPAAFVTVGGVINAAAGSLGNNQVRFIATNFTCADTASRVLIVSQNINSPISIQGDTILCPGDVIKLISGTTGAGIGYEWSRNGVPIPNSDNDTLNVSEAGTYRVKIIINGNGFCALPSTRIVTVIQGQAPVVNITGGDTLKVCYPGESINLNLVRPYTPADALWSGPGSLVTSNGVLSPANLTSEGTYPLILTKILGTCVATDTLWLKGFAVPDPVFLATANEVCDGDSATYTYVNPNLYRTIWLRNNTETLSPTNPNVLTVKTAATYNLIVQNNLCSASASRTLVINPNPVFTMPDAFDTCKNTGLIQLKLANNNSVGVWSGPGITDANLGNWNSNDNAVPASGEVMIIYTGSLGNCSRKDTVMIQVDPVPPANIVVDKPVIEIFGPAVMSVQTLPNSSIIWSPAATLNSNAGPVVSAKPEETTRYFVEVTSAKGCKNNSDTLIRVDRDFEIFDGFSPNSDGNNDFWNIKNIQQYPEAMVRVYNRWGNLVYESGKGYPVPWDGKYKGDEVPPGAYFYIIDLGGGLKPKSGSLTLVR